MRSRDVLRPAAAADRLRLEREPAGSGDVAVAEFLGAAREPTCSSERASEQRRRTERASCSALAASSDILTMSQRWRRSSACATSSERSVGVERRWRERQQRAAVRGAHAQSGRQDKNSAQQPTEWLKNSIRSHDCTGTRGQRDAVTWRRDRARPARCGRTRSRTPTRPSRRWSGRTSRSPGRRRGEGARW